MKLKYISDHKSVTSFAEIEISDFSFFMGKNGSGKTHLLQAIAESKIVVNDYSKNEIIYLNYLDFAYNFQKRTSYNYKIDAWNRLNSNDANDRIRQLKNPESSIDIFKKNIIEEVSKKLDKPIFDLLEDDFSSQQNQKEVFSVLEQYKNNLTNQINQNEYTGEEIAQSVYDTVILKSNVFLTNIKENEFKILFQKSAISGKKILSDLSDIFFEYYKNIKRNILQKSEGKPFLIDDEFIKKYGIAPWELVRNIFSGFGLNFDVNDPIQENIDSWNGSFQIVFKNLERNGAIVPFEDLSSGEGILITLINAIYTANKKSILSKILLLDEVDGPLNPSIVSKFISYIKENFVDRGIKVIIASHSPTTIAFADENSIYAINTVEPTPIKPVDNKGAIKILSEGFMTLSDLVEFEKITTSKVIISEGKNYKYLEKAKELDSSIDITVLHIRDLGFGQLRSLFDFLRIFNQEKKFIFVWDHDYLNETSPEVLKNTANKNNRVFVFNKNDAGVVTKGIENLINKIDCADYSGTYASDSSCPTNKEKFQKFVCMKDIKVFSNFKPLFDFLNDDTKFHNL